MTAYLIRLNQLCWMKYRNAPTFVGSEFPNYWNIETETPLCQCCCWRCLWTMVGIRIKSHPYFIVTALVFVFVVICIGDRWYRGSTFGLGHDVIPLWRLSWTCHCAHDIAVITIAAALDLIIFMSTNLVSSIVYPSAIPITHPVLHIRMVIQLNKNSWLNMATVIKDTGQSHEKCTWWTHQRLIVVTICMFWVSTNQIARQTLIDPESPIK